MLDRYSFDPIKRIWSQESKLALFIKIERAVNDALQQYKIIPENKLSDKLDKIDIKKLVKLTNELEEETHHDVNAFVFAAEKLCGKEGRWIHYGLTSYDLVDTANALMIRGSLIAVILELEKLERELFKKWKQYEGGQVKILGRTHGQHAEALELHRVFKCWNASVISCKHNLATVNVPGKISGALGDNKYIPGNVESECLVGLGLERADDTTQIVNRFYHADLISKLVLCSGCLENLALQIRLYQQSEVSEMREPFGAKQTGSSAMPHKRNSVLCENVCGLARIMRSYLGPAFENQATWHQRDMCQSSVERVILPDAFELLCFMIQRMTKIVAGLDVEECNIAKNLKSAGCIDSQGKLLEEIRKGKSRAEAYKAIQKGKK